MTEQSKAPTHTVSTVREGKGKSYFTRIGAAWPIKDGQGFSVQLDALPVNGKLVILPRKAAEADEVEYDEAGNTYSG